MEGADSWPAHAAFFDAVASAAVLWWKPEHRARSLVAERGARARGSASFEQVNAGVGKQLA
jgi:hypothetical protein